MVRIFTSLALAGALSMAAVPAFAQDVDLDPFHIFTPAPAAPAPRTMHHHHHHHMVMHRRGMMMQHKKMTMQHKKMMKK